MPIAPGSRYTLHPSYEYLAACINNLKQRTGRDIEEWTELVGRDGPPDAGSDPRVTSTWLRSVHRLGLNYASCVAERIVGGADPEKYDPDELVRAMYAGPKEPLLAIHHRLIDIGLALAPDVKACPCSTIVPLFRKHVFAQIKPSTRTRIDLGFALKDRPVSGRLIDTGGFAKGDRISHRIAITGISDIDDEVLDTLRAAYDLDR